MPKLAHKPTRILFVMYTAQIAGPAHSLIALLPYLKPQYDVSVLLPENGPLCGMLDQINVPFFVIPKLDLRSIPKIYQLIRRERFDLVYANNPSGRSRNSLIAAKLARRPVIWHFRIKQRVIPWKRRVFLPFADAIVAVSEGVADSIRRYFPQQHIDVVYNGVPLEKFQGDREVARAELARELGISPEHHIIINVGHLNTRKQQLDATTAVSKTLEQVGNVHLLLVGDKTDIVYYEQVRTSIDSHDLESNVHVLGLRDDVPKLLLASDIYLHTANVEGHPRAVIEGMAAALPIVAYAIDGVSETIPESAGALVSLGDTNALARELLNLLERDVDRKAIGQAAYNHVISAYSSDITASHIIEVIERVLGKQV